MVTTFSLNSLSPPASMTFSSSVDGTSSLTANDLVFVAFRDAIRNKALVNLRHWPSDFCSNHTTTSTDDFPTQLAWPDNRISESCYAFLMTKTPIIRWTFLISENVPTLAAESVNEISSTRIVTNVYGNGMSGSKFGILTCWCITHTEMRIHFGDD